MPNMNRVRDEIDNDRLCLSIALEVGHLIAAVDALIEAVAAVADTSDRSLPKTLDEPEPNPDDKTEADRTVPAGAHLAEALR